MTFTQAAAGSQTFTVSTMEDTFDESGETFSVSISSPSVEGEGPHRRLGTAKTVTTTINDDDDALTGIELSVEPSELGEDEGETEITVTATLKGGETTRPTDTVVTIGTFTGSATKGTDYAATALASITIPADTSTGGTGTLKITPTDDSSGRGRMRPLSSPGRTDQSVGLSVTSPRSITLTDDDKSTTGPEEGDDKDSSRDQHKRSQWERGRRERRRLHGDAIGGRIEGSDRRLVRSAIYRLRQGCGLGRHEWDGDLCGEQCGRELHRLSPSR